LDIKSNEVAVGDEDVEKALEELRQRTADWVPVERQAGEGDAVLVDYVRLNAKGKPIHRSETKDALVELDASGLLPEFRQNLLGKKTGDNANFSVTYPAEFGNEELRGKAVTFSLQVKGVRERKVRDLDDAFATEVVGMRDLAELRARVRLNLEGRRSSRRSRVRKRRSSTRSSRKTPSICPRAWCASIWKSSCSV